MRFGVFFVFSAFVAVGLANVIRFQPKHNHIVVSMEKTKNQMIDQAKNMEHILLNGQATTEEEQQTLMREIQDLENEINSISQLIEEEKGKLPKNDQDQPLGIRKVTEVTNTLSTTNQEIVETIKLEKRILIRKIGEMEQKLKYAPSTEQPLIVKEIRDTQKEIATLDDIIERIEQTPQNDQPIRITEATELPEFLPSTTKQEIVESMELEKQILIRQVQQMQQQLKIAPSAQQPLIVKEMREMQKEIATLDDIIQSTKQQQPQNDQPIVQPQPINFGQATELPEFVPSTTRQEIVESMELQKEVMIRQVQQMEQQLKIAPSTQQPLIVKEMREMQKVIATLEDIIERTKQQPQNDQPIVQPINFGQATELPEFLPSTTQEEIVGNMELKKEIMIRQVQQMGQQLKIAPSTQQPLIVKEIREMQKEIVTLEDIIERTKQQPQNDQPNLQPLIGSLDQTEEEKIQAVKDQKDVVIGAIRQIKKQMEQAKNVQELNEMQRELRVLLGEVTAMEEFLNQKQQGTIGLDQEQQPHEFGTSLDEKIKELNEKKSQILTLMESTERQMEKAKNIQESAKLAQKMINLAGELTEVENELKQTLEIGQDQDFQPQTTFPVGTSETINEQKIKALKQTKQEIILSMTQDEEILKTANSQQAKAVTQDLLVLSKELNRVEKEIDAIERSFIGQDVVLNGRHGFPSPAASQDQKTVGQIEQEIGHVIDQMNKLQTQIFNNPNQPINVRVESVEDNLEKLATELRNLEDQMEKKEGNIGQDEEGREQQKGGAHFVPENIQQFTETRVLPENQENERPNFKSELGEQRDRQQEKTVIEKTPVQKRSCMRRCNASNCLHKDLTRNCFTDCLDKCGF